MDIVYPGCPPSGSVYAGVDAAAESIGKSAVALSWVVGDRGVYRANMQPERERKRGERIAVRTCVPRTVNLRLSAAALHFANHCLIARSTADHHGPLQW